MYDEFMYDYEGLDVYQKWREERHEREIEGMTLELLASKLRDNADARSAKNEEANLILKFIETPHVTFVPSDYAAAPSTSTKAFYFTRQCDLREEEDSEEDREEAREDWFENKREQDLEDRIQVELDDRDDY